MTRFLYIMLLLASIGISSLATYVIRDPRGMPLMYLEIEFNDGIENAPGDIRRVTTYFTKNGLKIMHGETKEWRRVGTGITETTTMYRYGEKIMEGSKTTNN